jgi:uncharacterized protein YyaL (SSP411 family)
VARTLTSPEGGFYSALDAETDGDEGGYYVWTREQIKQVLTDPTDEDLFARVYGFDRPANFENERYVLTRRRTVKEEEATFDMTPEALEARLAPLRAKLLAAREKRPAPLRDDKILTAWNGLMIAAYADGFRVLKEDRYRQAAESAADFLMKRVRAKDGRLLRTYRAGQAKLPAYLEDYAFLIHGLLRLHAATGDANRLNQARTLTDLMIADFTDKKDGGFFYTAEGHESLLARTKDPFDNAIPSGNSVAIRDLIALAAATGEKRYLDEAGKALDAFSAILTASPGGVPVMLVGLLEYFDARPNAAAGAVAGAADAPGSPTQGTVTAKASLAPSAKVFPGADLDVTVSLTVKEGWHIYANPLASETLKPTILSLGSGMAVTLVKIDYPSGKAKILAGEDEKIPVYEGHVNLVAHLRVEQEAKPGPLDLEFKLRYQPCNDRACLAPATLTVPLHLEVGAK